jgi:hypothetical protein
MGVMEFGGACVNIQRVLEMLINLHNGRLVTASVTVIGS